MIPDVSGAPQVFLCHHIPNLKPQATDMSLKVETLKLWVCFLFWKDEVGRGKKLSFHYWFCLQKMNTGILSIPV